MDRLISPCMLGLTANDCEHMNQGERYPSENLSAPDYQFFVMNPIFHKFIKSFNHYFDGWIILHMMSNML